jgi:hypothetical protein
LCNLTTGLLLTILEWFDLLHSSTKAAAYQNFLITIEMFLAAVLLRSAFPYKFYMDLRKDEQGRGIPMKKITSHFRDTLNPHDVVDDAIHNFSRVYQKYAKQGDASDGDSVEGEWTVGINKNAAEGEQVSDEDSPKPKTVSPTEKLSKLIASAGKREPSGGFERVTLLVESDEDEIM